MQEESTSFKEQYDVLLAQVTEQQSRLLQLHTEHVQQEEVRRTSESMVVINSTLEEEDATGESSHNDVIIWNKRILRFSGFFT